MGEPPESSDRDLWNSGDSESSSSRGLGQGLKDGLHPPPSSSGSGSGLRSGDREEGLGLTPGSSPELEARSSGELLRLSSAGTGFGLGSGSGGGSGSGSGSSLSWLGSGPGSGSKSGERSGFELDIFLEADRRRPGVFSSFTSVDQNQRQQDETEPGFGQPRSGD